EQGRERLAQCGAQVLRQRIGGGDIYLSAAVAQRGAQRRAALAVERGKVLERDRDQLRFQLRAREPLQQAAQEGAGLIQRSRFGALRLFALRFFLDGAGTRAFLVQTPAQVREQAFALGADFLAQAGARLLPFLLPDL